MFGTASFTWRKSTDFILEGNYIVRYMTQYFKDIGPQIMPRESTHSGVKAWIEFKVKPDVSSMAFLHSYIIFILSLQHYYFD